MPHNHHDPKQQFQAVEDLLTRWMRERADVLASYTDIAASVDTDSSGKALHRGQQRLCELLVDYISAGHFEVFHELLEEAEAFADGSQALAGQLMPDIGATTEVILAYEEKYADGKDYPATLKRDLSSLGEVLESRFVLEDRLIAGLHQRHRRLVGDQAPLTS